MRVLISWSVWQRNYAKVMNKSTGIILCNNSMIVGLSNRVLA